MSVQETVLKQFSSFQCLDKIPKTDVRIDEVWTAIGELKDETGEACFQQLSQVMCGIMTIPHSSAHCERVFSCVRKCRTDQRASLSDSTLESLLLLKSWPGSFGERHYSNHELDRFKSAYYRTLKSRCETATTSITE